ncbi:MAG: PQQ-binding-like beta-propeller repeat protein [Fuerstiella sp.]
MCCNDRRGTWHETGILSQFPDDGLKPVWKVAIGSGYAGPVVSAGLVFVPDYLPKPDTTTLEAVERLLCLDEDTGDVLWKHEWSTHL